MMQILNPILKFKSIYFGGGNCAIKEKFLNFSSDFYCPRNLLYAQLFLNVTFHLFSAAPEQLQIPWDSNPTISSFFTQPQQRSSEMCYSTDPHDYSSPDSKDVFTDHQDCKIVPTSYSTVFSISLQQAPPQRCGRGFEVSESELVLPHRTSGHQVPF